MNPESLQTVSVLAIALGFVLIGFGGFTAYTASQKVQHSAELRAVEQKGELNTQIMTLLMKNQELLSKLEQRRPAPEVAATPPGHHYRPPSPPPPPVQTPESALPPVEEGPAESYHSAEPAEPVPPPITLQETPEAESSGSSGVEPELPSRHLSLRQQHLITDTLRAHGKHTVTIESSFGDAISHEFAEELAEAFAQADWTVRGIDPHRGLPLNSGVTVSAGSFPPQQETRAVYEALLNAGIAVTQQLDPKQHNGETVLLVGTPL